MNRPDPVEVMNGIVSHLASSDYGVTAEIVEPELGSGWSYAICEYTPKGWPHMVDHLSTSLIVFGRRKYGIECNRLLIGDASWISPVDLKPTVEDSRWFRIAMKLEVSP